MISSTLNNIKDKIGLFNDYPSGLRKVHITLSDTAMKTINENPFAESYVECDVIIEV